MNFNLNRIIDELEERGLTQTLNILDEQELLSMNQYFDTRSSDFELARVVYNESNLQDDRIRGDFVFEMDQSSPPEPFREIIDFLNSFKIELEKRRGEKIKGYLCYLSEYPPTGYFAKHTDDESLITFVFYIHHEWKQEYGGQLTFYNESLQETKRIDPIPGSFVAFFSPGVTHAVKVCYKKRRSVLGWIHNRSE